MPTKRKATHVVNKSGERIYVSAKTKTELEQKKREARNTFTSVRFSDYGEVWLRAYKAPPKMRETSYVTLLNTYRKHVESYFGEMDITAITPIQVQLWLNTIADMSGSVQRKCLQYLRGIFNTAVDNGIITRSPVTSTIKVSAAPKEEEEPLTDEQAKTLLRATEGTNAYLFVLIALSTGMRRGEILGLMWEDIDFDKRVINVTHNKAFRNDSNDAPVTTLLKTEAAKRRIPISEKLYDELVRQRGLSISPFVISMENGNSMSKGAFRAMWGIIEKRTAGDGKKLGDKLTTNPIGCNEVLLDFHVHPHLLRHTFCTQLIEAGLPVKDVQYLMGHASPDITMKVYTHYRQKSREAETAAAVRGAISYL